MKKIRNYILLLIFTILVLYFTLKDDFESIINSILKMNPIWFIIVLVLMLIGFLFKTKVLKTYVNHYNKEYSYFKALKLQIESAFFNGITPFSSGGQPFQIIVLKKDGVRVGHSTNVIFITSFIFQFSLFVISTICIIANQFLHLFSPDSHIKYLSILGYVINIVFMAFLLLVIFNKKMKKKLVMFISKIISKMKFIKKRDKLIYKLEETTDVMGESATLIRKDKTGFILCSLYDIIANLIYCAIPYFLAKGMGITGISFINSIITSAYVILIGFFVPIPGGTGGLEYAFVALFKNFILIPAAKSLMLVWRFVTYYLGVIMGAIVLNLDKKKK